jgi:hypothetical protein
MNAQQTTVKQPTILLIHIAVGMFFMYLSWSIITKRSIPNFVGVGLGILSVALIIAQIYFYRKETKDKFSFLRDYNPSDYKSIGGVSGLGWVN